MTNSDEKIQKLIDSFVETAQEEFINTPFSDEWGEYLKLTDEEKTLVAKGFYKKVTKLPITTDKTVYGYKLILKRLHIEKSRSKNTENIDAMISELEETIRHERFSNLKNYIQYNFDWYYIFLRSEQEHIQSFINDYNSRLFGKYKISIFPDEEWRNTQTGNIVIVSDVVEHTLKNGRKLYFVVNKDKSNPQIRSTATEISEFRKDYELHLTDLNYYYNFLNGCECNCGYENDYDPF